MANQTEKSQGGKSSEKGSQSTEIQHHETPSGGLSQYSGWISSPFSFMRRFSEEMDRLFEDFGFGGSLARSTGGQISPREFGRGLWRPPIEMLTKGDQLIVKAELPGMAKDDIKVECTNDEITIQGEKRQEHKEEHEGTFHNERSYGRFFRQIPLPEGTNADDAKATFRDGILEIRLKAPQQSKSRQISIDEK